MACALTQSYTVRDCKAPAGVVRYLITPFSNVTAYTLTSGVITAITKTTTFKSYEQEPEVADWKCNVASDNKNGTYGFDLEVNFQTHGLDALLQTELELLIKNKLLVIAQMNDGTYWCLGKEYGLHVMTDNFESGVAFTDFQGDKIQLKGKAISKPLSVSSSVIAGLLA